MYNMNLKVVNVCEQIYFLTEITCLVAALEYYWPIVPNSLWFDHLPQCNPMYVYLSRKICASWNDLFSTKIFHHFPFLWQSSISVKVFCLFIFEEKNPVMKFSTIFYIFFAVFKIWMNKTTKSPEKFKKWSGKGPDFM